MSTLQRAIEILEAQCTADRAAVEFYEQHTPVPRQNQATIIVIERRLYITKQNIELLKAHHGHRTDQQSAAGQIHG